MPAMRSNWVLAIPVTMTVFAACGCDSSSEDPAAEAGVIELVDAGREPRRVLTWKPRPGTTESFSVSFRKWYDDSVEDFKPPRNKTAPIVLAGEAEVLEIDPQGRTKLRCELALPPDSREPTAPLPIYGSRYTVDPQGKVLESQVQLVEAIPQSLRDVMEVFVQCFPTYGMALPREPVGVGARWELRSKLDYGGVHRSLIWCYELTVLDGERVAIQVDLKGSAPRQRLEDPPIAEARNYTLNAWDAKGSAMFDLDLDRWGSRRMTMWLTARIYTMMLVGEKKKQHAWQEGFAIEIERR